MGAILLVGVAALGTLGLLYWLIVIGEGTYLGPWAVRLIYRFGAPVYDTVRAGAIHDDQQVLLPMLLAALRDVPAPYVLDVATGTGRVPLLLAAAPGFSGSSVGLDLTAEMLAQAQTKQQASCPQAAIEWRLGGASRLEWPDCTFDLVTCLEALEYFPRPRRALAEMARVLRPGATLVLSKMPDSWARILPARGHTRSMLQRELMNMGLTNLSFCEWQPGHYELVIARKI